MLRFLLLLLLATPTLAQKTAYIPQYLQNPNDVNGAQFSWSKTAQSANFTLIWGNTVGTDPANYPDPDLNFDPARILDTMEYIYAAFKTLGFVDDTAGTNLSMYKIPIVMYATWGPNGAQGWANGGDADGVVGAFWVHPNAMNDGGVAAHELTHSLQAQCNIDARAEAGLGYVWLNAGIFWETHANFMRNLLYPQAVSAWGMDVYHTETFGDWKNTYENYPLLFAIMASEGIGMVNRLWRESLSNEYPLQAYKRLAGYNQAQFNDSLFLYARRMATYDFTYNNVGAYFRQYRTADLANYLYSTQATFSILRKVPGATNRYEIPIETAPEEYAYNIIPLYPNNDSCAVIIKFKGHTEANSHAGWRYGFVAAHANGTVSRYSPVYADNTREINFRLEAGETQMYLVVMGAPHDQITTNTTNDTWRGYPKHFRHPYELTISGAVPEGFQAPASFRAQLKTNGHIHSNGGGWVQNSATVAASVYVAPGAIVLGNANLSGTVRLENTALVKNAVMTGNVVVRNNAFVNGGTYSGNAVVQGQGFAENVTMSQNALIGMRAKVSNYSLSGTVEVGGDVVVYNEDGNCNNGVHYRLTNYYDNKLLECDGRTATHPVNLDVNNTYTTFSNEDMALQCQCAFETTPITIDSVFTTPVTCSTPDAGSVQFFISKSCAPFQYAWSKNGETGSNLTGLFAGDYTFTITDALGREVTVPVVVPAETPLEIEVVLNDVSCHNGNDGFAIVAPMNGTAPYTWLWSDGQTGSTATNLSSGNYSVTITDANGCMDVQQIFLQSPLPLNVLLDGPTSLCTWQIGTVSASVTGGTAPYQLNWPFNNPSFPTVFGPGTYNMEVIDANGCTALDTLEIEPAPPLEISANTTPVQCFGDADGSISVGANMGTPPLQWLWTGGQTGNALTGLSAGAYQVTVTDDVGCNGMAEFVVVEPTPLVLQNAYQPVQCFNASDGWVTVTPSGGTPGYTYLWNNLQTTDTLSGIPAGVWAVTVTDANGCTNNAGFLLNNPLPLVVQVEAPVVLCAGYEGTTQTTVSGGIQPYTYLWSTGETNPNYTSLAGTFTLTVTDSRGCENITNVIIPEATEVQVVADIQNASSAQSSDGAVLLTALSGGVVPYTSYLWSTGDTTQSLVNVPPGVYTLTITDGAGCLSISNYTVSFGSAVNGLSSNDFKALIVPNPSVGAAQLWLETSENQSLNMVISEASGRVVYRLEQVFPAGKNVLPMPEGFVAGVYWVKVTQALGRSLEMRWVVVE